MRNERDDALGGGFNMHPSGDVFAASIERLMAAALARLLEFCEEGVPILKTDAKTGATSMVGRAPASAPYLSAALKLLKEVGAFGGRDASAAADDLAQELAALPAFDAAEDDFSTADDG